MRISRTNAVNALHEGIDARQEDKPVTACPYPFDGSLGEQFMAQWWVKGWRRAGMIEAEVPQT